MPVKDLDELIASVEEAHAEGDEEAVACFELRLLESAPAELVALLSPPLDSVAPDLTDEEHRAAFQRTLARLGLSEDPPAAVTEALSRAAADRYDERALLDLQNALSGVSVLDACEAVQDLRGQAREMALDDLSLAYVTRRFLGGQLLRLEELVVDTRKREQVSAALVRTVRERGLESAAGTIGFGAIGRGGPDPLRRFLESVFGRTQVELVSVLALLQGAVAARLAGHLAGEDEESFVAELEAQLRKSIGDEAIRRVLMDVAKRLP